ncbi:type II secretion system protein GspF [Rhodoferax lacus]|uniref:Type II secretion system protein GspF n=1 Tax=Rhodoferax lacus TaxID=2184758 RepID=A0A3E1REF6_9BURK|nr:type II secretion system inner membrane protein GspF [Rhodoferax lacus]RFO97611.1 type II secretion system protein GspF [Rhodoferax lacus]
MPAYSFTALDDQGQTRKGTLEADSAKSARTQLRAQSFIPLSVQVLAGRPLAEGSARGWHSRVINSNELAIWTRQLAELVSSGLPLEQALGSLAEESESEAHRNLNAALRASVNGGTSFAKALEQHPLEFADIYVAVVGAGEQSGHLSLVLVRLAEDLEERQVLKSKLLGAALYPAIVSLVAVVIVLFLVGYVVPQVAHVFAGSKHALPFLTVAMMAISDFVRGYGWLVALLLAAGSALLWQMLKNTAFRERWDAAWLNLPILGKLARGYNAARFAGTLSMLTAAGVPILQALQAAAQTLSNQALKRDALDALVLVREGAPLAAALAQKKRFPGLLSMFARLGEQTGQLPSMLDRAAKQLSTEVQRRAMHLATILEPLLIVVMGLVVMLIVLAVLMPIIQLNQWVK